MQKLLATCSPAKRDREVAVIPCASVQDGEKLEQTARLLALQAEQAALGLLQAGVEANAGGQLLMMRALHYFARRAELLYAAAAVREADINDPMGLLLAAETRPHVPVGVHPLLMPLPGHECLHLGQDPGGLGREDPEDDAPKVKFTPGHNYVFSMSDGRGDVRVQEVPLGRGSLEFRTAGQQSGLGTWTFDDVREEVFIKEKKPELDGGGMPLLLRQTALEAATCASLASLDCLVKVRAVQVTEECVRMVFDKLPGRCFDEFLDILEAKQHRATESEIMGGVILTLAAHLQLNLAGFNQRDAKSENLWLSASNGILRVVVTDSEAVFKDGHIEDAHMVGLGNEVWQLRAVRDRKLWRFGGTNFSRAVSVFAANMDLQCKQSTPGEQAIVYSLSEIILRMMGEGEKVWTCCDDAKWEDALKNGVNCDLFSDDEEEEESGDEERQPARSAKGLARPSASSVYSAAFLHLVMTLRRRSFTQGGVDAFLDLGQALQLCRDFIGEHLKSTEAACLGDFARLVSQFEGLHAAHFLPQVQTPEPGPPPPAPAEAAAAASTPPAADLPVGPRRMWSELSEKDMSSYYVCPVVDKMECNGSTTFEVIGLALRRRRHVPIKFGSDMELLMKTPHTPGEAPQPVCFANLMWWQRMPEIEEVVLQCLRTRSHDLAGCGEMLIKSLEAACRHPLRVHSDVLCFHLELSKEHLSRGHSSLPDWPLVAMFPYTEEVKLSVIASMRKLSGS